MNRLRLAPMLSNSLVALTCACGASMSAASTADVSATSESSAGESEPAEPASPDAPTAAGMQPSPSAEGVAPNASDGPPETRTLTAIAKLVKDNRQPVRDCYQRARETQPELKGTLTIHFTLDPDGAVKSAEVNAERTDLQSPEVAACAIKLIRDLKYPPSSRGMESEVNYPFELMP
ncbi:MAG: AgmX/PglI C-terminal domain-containing protein [Polyangiaceae bacterium]|nr:AgmX/PglI C-terminal domain-containing protein [Polyangiaceae bacterium]